MKASIGPSADAQYAPSMAITWSDAVKDADNSDDMQRYERAVQQARDLDPLLRSFGEAVCRSEKWPFSLDDYTKVRTNHSLHTRAGQVRHVWLSPDGTWGIDLGAQGWDVGITGYLMRKTSGADPTFWHQGKTATIAAEDFHARMDAMEQTKDWVPRELVAYLRTHNIPIPD